MVRIKFSYKSFGIYQIQSKIKPERIYIGSAININARWKLHMQMLKKNTHHSRKLQRHYNKYGIEDLQFSIIRKCKKERLLSLEQFFIDKWDPYFNICKIVGSSFGVIRTKTYKEKMSKTKKEFFKTEEGKIVRKKMIQFRKIKYLGEGNPNYGKHPSEDTRKKMSESRNSFYKTNEGIKLRKKKSLDNIGKIKTEETKKLISKSNIAYFKTEKGILHKQKLKNSKTPEFRKKVSKSKIAYFKTEKGILHKQKLRETMIKRKGIKYKKL